MVKKRVAYSVDTKNKAVEMKLQGYSTKQIMQELNIKKWNSSSCIVSGRIER